MHDIQPPPTTSVGLLTTFARADLYDLCDAAEAAIRDGGGFGWVEPPARDIMERYWRGVLTVPGRSLIVGRLDGVIAGSTQLVRPPPNNEAQGFAAQITTHFVAPWARGHGLAAAMTEAATDLARHEGFGLVTLDVRETQLAAIHVFRRLGFVEWGRNPFYAKVKGRIVAGLHFYKRLEENGGPEHAHAHAHAEAEGTDTPR